ncbi:MAG: hypothetical protein U0793_11970 [Gemmataceae bacterium]
MEIASYAPAVRDLIAEAPLQPLGPGRPIREKRSALAALTPAQVAGESADDKLGRACLAGLWLLYNFTDESHALSQDLDTVEGSYWHAILHRREPDYWNSKYWFRRVGRHAIFGELARAAGEIALAPSCPAEGKYLVGQGTWDPFAFVDLCEKASHGPAGLEDLCRKVQQREWELLFDHCASNGRKRAAGS